MGPLVRVTRDVVIGLVVSFGLSVSTFGLSDGTSLYEVVVATLCFLLFLEDRQIETSGASESAGLGWAAMSSFSSQHAPPYPIAGPDIAENVRVSLLGWFNTTYDIRAAEIWRQLRHAEGFSTDWEATTRDIYFRFGEEAAQEFYNATANVPGTLNPRITVDDRYAAPSLRTVPTPLFLDALEYALDLVARIPSREDEIGGFVAVAAAHLNGVFEKRGIQYRFTDYGKAEWHGDPGTYHQVIAPALAALDDPRLAGCRTEFEDALTKLRRRTSKDLEDAVEESAKAVESAMEVVLDESGVPLPKPKTAEPLWTALRDAGLVPTPTKDAIMAASRLRNPLGGHGTGSQPRQLPDGVPELAVQSAASAITYLARHLPS
jgi:hypothetical protein